MTTREFQPPVLDRIIERLVTTTVEIPASMVYPFNELYTGGGDDLDPGTWIRESDTVLLIDPVDSNGISFPTDLVTPLEGVGVAFDGADATTLTITGLEVSRHPFTFQIQNIRLTFGSALPAAGTVLTLSVETEGTQTVTQTVTRKEWASRRDFLGRDLTRVTSTDSVVTIQDTRFIVRAGGLAWKENDTLTDDEGVSRIVQGVAQIGRGRYLELLARSIG